MGCQSVPGELPEFVDGRTGQALDRYYERHDLLAPLLRHGSGDGDLGDTIMAAVKRLRRKLDAHGIGHAISTVRGVGYQLVSSTLRAPMTG